MINDDDDDGRGRREARIGTSRLGLARQALGRLATADERTGIGPICFGTSSGRSLIPASGWATDCSIDSTVGLELSCGFRKRVAGPSGIVSTAARF